MVQEFHLSITPVRSDEYLVRVEWMEPGVPLAEEQVQWPVDDWLARARQVFTEPLAEFVNRDSSGGVPLADGNGGGGETYKVITLNPLQAEGALTGVNPSSGAAIAPEPALVQLGQELYDALFQGTIRDAWVMAQGVAQNHEQPLRLRLGMKGDRIQRLPWEVLHAANRPLAASTDIVFSRYHSSFTTVAPAQRHTLTEPPLPPALQILMVLSAPTDQANLELKREAMQLQQELGSHRSSDRPSHYPHIELTLLEQPGREALTQMLEQAHYQVFHFAGHSSPGACGGKLHLVNANTGLTESLNGDDLAGLLVNNGIKLAVFNSCLGTQAATSDEFDLKGERTLAEALIHRGIPSVLAMAERIPDQVALNLSRLFYRNLKFGHPLDVSLCRARQGLISSYGSNQLYWALPILYLQTNFEGRLVRPNGEVEADELSGSRNLAVEPAAVPGLYSAAPATLSLWEEDASTASTLDLDPNPHLSNNGGDLALVDSGRRPSRGALSSDTPSDDDGPGRIDLATALTLSDSDDLTASGDRQLSSPWKGAQSGARRSKRPLLLALGGIAAIALIGGAGWGIGRVTDRSAQSPFEDTTPSSPKDFRETTSLVENAIDAYQSGDLEAGNLLSEQLLNRNVLEGAETALNVPGRENEAPEIQFLLGRLHWQKQFASELGPKKFDNSYRAWYFALKKDPGNGRYLTALGFAAYAKGDLDDAQEQWQQAVKQLKGQDDSEARRLYLSAKAGLALIQQNLAMKEPVGKQAELLNSAINGYDFVAAEDFESFNPRTLGLNPETQWLWNEALVEEWLALSALSTTTTDE